MCVVLVLDAMQCCRVAVASFVACFAPWNVIVVYFGQTSRGRTDGRDRRQPTAAAVAAATDRPQRGQPPLSVRVVRGARKPKDGRRDGRRDGGAHALGIHLGGGGAWRKRKKWAAKEGIAGPAAGPPGGEWVVNMKTISKIELKTRCWPPPRRKVKTVSHAQCTRTKPILKFWGWRKE